MCLIRFAEWDSHTFENLHRGRRGERETSVCAINPAAAFVHRGKIDLFNPERLKADTGADNIRNGIQRPYLVKVHVIHGHPMDPPFRFRDPVENAEGMLFNEGRKIAVLDQLADLPVCPAMYFVVVMMMVMMPTALLAMFVVMVVLVSVVMLMLMMVFMGMFMLLLMPSLRPGHLAAVVLIIGLRTACSGGFHRLTLVCVGVCVLVFMAMAVVMGLHAGMFMMPVSMGMLMFILLVCMRCPFVDAEVNTLDLLPLRPVEVHVEIADIHL